MIQKICDFSVPIAVPLLIFWYSVSEKMQHFLLLYVH